MKRLFIVLSISILVGLVGAACGPVTTPLPRLVETSPADSQPEPSRTAATSPDAAVPAAESTPAGSYPSPVNTLSGPEEPSPAPQEAGNDPASQAEPAQPLPVTIPAGFPDTSAFTWKTVVTGVDRPLDLHGDGLGRMLLVDQHGRIHVIENDALRGSLYLDLTDRVVIEGNEMGLLGLALHPDYRENGYLYVNYTGLGGDTFISRFTADPQAAVADPGSEKVLLRVDQPYKNHNGGALAFGPDGYLYIGLGDGGQAGDPHGNGQNLNTYLGKILRIDVDGGDPYAIPADNPYSGGGGYAEIWASGLRNPWRFSFDSLTGDLYIGDVGQNKWEEIDFIPAGAPGGINFGWDYREGLHPYEGNPPQGLALTDPIYEYPHPEGCSVTGGVVYRGQVLPEFHGIYLFGDYCTGKIWGLYRDANGQWQNQMLFEGGFTPSSFGTDDESEVYLMEHPSGVVLKLVRK